MDKKFENGYLEIYYNGFWIKKGSFIQTKLNNNKIYYVLSITLDEVLLLDLTDGSFSEQAEKHSELVPVSELSRDEFLHLKSLLQKYRLQKGFS